MYMTRKVRTQLYLTWRQKKALEAESRASGKSSAELVREAVEQVYLKSAPADRPLGDDDPFWDFVGGGSSQERDISKRHDEYLYGDEP